MGHPRLERVTKHTRAKFIGTSIVCPNCHGIKVVYHFSWYASQCPRCGLMIDKTDWWVIR